MKKVDSYGPQPSRIMVVGEAPGSQEEILGRPFVGPAGGVLREVLFKAGIDPDTIRYANLSKYRPPKNDFDALLVDGLPGEQLLEGLSELRDDIEATNPNVIIACGSQPLRFLTGYQGITDYRGSILAGGPLAAGRKVIPTFHPSYILRGNQREKPIMRFDLSRALEQSKFPEIRRPEKRLYKVERENVSELIRHADGTKSWEPCELTADYFRETLINSKMLTFDIEYIGSRLLCIGMTNSAGWAVCFVIHSPEDTARCQRILESGVPLCAQNAMFDVGILEWHYKFDVMKYIKFDTMVAMYNLNIEYPKDLGFMMSLYTEQPQYKGMVDWDKIKKGTQSVDDVWEYNCIDTWGTHAIMEQQDVELDSDPKYREAFEFDMKKFIPLWKIACRGVRVDKERLVALSNELRAAIEEDQMILDAANGMMELNVKSKKQVVALLQKYGLKLTRKTPTGQFKDDDITLAALLLHNPTPQQKCIIQAIRRIRESRDLISKFCNIDMDDDGRMRCIYDATKTTTRRLSSKVFFPTGKGTNLQNIPRDKRVRSVFIPDPGLKFGYADLKAAEFVVVAYLSQDAEMLRLVDMTISGTGDVHEFTARFLLEKLAHEVVTKDERFLGKKTRHSANYMIGWKKFMDNVNADPVAEKTGVTIDAKTAKKLLDRYQKLHPGLAQWWRATETELRENRYLRNCFGFRRTFNDNPDAVLPEAIAFRPQSTIGDCLNFGLLACANHPRLAELGFEILLQVHDAIGFQYPEENEEEIFKLVREAMDIPIPINGQLVHIPVDIKSGPSWGEAEEH